MKLSSNSIGMLIFIALATAVFVLMVLRPAVDGNAMNLGMPMMGDKASTEMVADAPAAEAVVEKVEEKMEEVAADESATEAETTETEAAGTEGGSATESTDDKATETTN